MLFINYRINDSKLMASVLENDLKDEFGADSVFRDNSGIDAGDKYSDEIQDKLSKCRVMLTLIGPQWEKTRFLTGNLKWFPRLHNTKDWVRSEIEFALASQNAIDSKERKVLIPILLDGAKVPDADWLANFGLQPLASFKHFELRTNEYREDFKKLIDVVRKKWPQAPLRPLIEKKSNERIGETKDLIWASCKMKWDECVVHLDEWLQNRQTTDLLMVHVSGWVFRKQRIEWQLKETNRWLPKEYRVSNVGVKPYFVGDDVKTEKKSESIERIKIELAGQEPPWPRTLSRLTVFIGSKECFKDWKKVNQEQIESQEATKYFWTEYLKKLCEVLGDGRKPSFEAELYEIDSPPFYAYVFQAGKQGRIVRLTRTGHPPHDSPSADLLEWSAFDSRRSKEAKRFIKDINGLKNAATKIWPCPK